MSLLITTDDRVLGVVVSSDPLFTFVAGNDGLLSKPKFDALLELKVPNAEEFKSIPPEKVNDGNTDVEYVASVDAEHNIVDEDVVFFRSVRESRFVCIAIKAFMWRSKLAVAVPADVVVVVSTTDDVFEEVASIEIISAGCWIESSARGRKKSLEIEGKS